MLTSLRHLSTNLNYINQTDGAEEGKAEQKVSGKNEHLVLFPVNAEKAEVNNILF